MKAYVYSSIDAHSLLHCLRAAAAELPDVYPIAEIPYHQASTAIGELHLTHRTTDQDVAVTISQLDQRSLIARLDDEKELDLATTKRLLGSALSPLVTQYNGAKKDGLAADDQAMVVFEDDVSKAN
jgi:hypothetical protein